jgi:hypothetical protein
MMASAERAVGRAMAAKSGSGSSASMMTGAGRLIFYPPVSSQGDEWRFGKPFFRSWFGVYRIREGLSRGRREILRTFFEMK